jgi:hypothetical protein
VRPIDAVITPEVPITKADTQLPTSALLLVISNLLPLIGVIWWGWNAYLLVLLFWCENVVVGVFNILRMVTANGGGLGGQLSKVFLIPFFTFHYGMFTFVHGIFVVAMFSGGFGTGTSGATSSLPASAGPGSLLAVVTEAIRSHHLGWPLLALVLSHGFSFATNYIGSGEYRRITAPELMGRPYGRIIALHVTILIGGFLALATNSHWAAMAILVAMKIAMDLKAHLAERRLLAKAK